MFEVQKYSQFLDIKSRKWREKSCGIIALKSVLEYWGEFVRAYKLIREGLKIKAYIPGIGWKHAGLASLATRHGFKAKNFDWFKKNDVFAWKNLTKKLKGGPIIVSIYKNLKPGTSGHLVVVTSIKNGFVHYNDPASRARRGVLKKASEKKFRRGWKKRIIVIYGKY